MGGDIPDDPSLVASEFAHAMDLVELAREIGEFSIGVAPTHRAIPSSPDLARTGSTSPKARRAADFAVTQFFFDVEEWTRLVEELGSLGVTKPVLPGIMPVTSLGRDRAHGHDGGRVPQNWSLASKLHGRGGPTAVRAEGIGAAVELCARVARRRCAGPAFLHSEPFDCHARNLFLALRTDRRRDFGPSGALVSP